MIVLWLIGSEHRHFGRWIGEVGISANRKPCEVGNTRVENSAILSRVANIEMTVGRVVRIKRHPENSSALAISDFEGNIEKWGWIDRSRWKVDDLNLSVLLCHKTPAGVTGRCTYVKRQCDNTCEWHRF